MLISDIGGNKVVRFEYPSGRPIDHFIASGISDLDNSRGMAFDPQGRLYVVSQDTDQVIRYNPVTGQFIDIFVTTNDPGNLNAPNELLWFRESGEDRLLVSGVSNDAIKLYNSTGQFVRNFIVSTAAAVLDGPVGFAIRPTPANGAPCVGAGDIYVCSNGNDRVLRYSGTTGAFIEQVFGPGELGLDGPIDLVFDSNSDMYVSSAISNSILVQRCDQSKSIYIPSGSGGLLGPQGLAIDDSGTLVITASGGNGAVYRAPNGVVTPLLLSNAGGLSSDPVNIVFLPEPCRADFNADGAINTQDFFDFISAFFAGCQ